MNHQAPRSGAGNETNDGLYYATFDDGFNGEDRMEIFDFDLSDGAWPSREFYIPGPTRSDVGYSMQHGPQSSDIGPVYGHSATASLVRQEGGGATSSIVLREDYQPSPSLVRGEGPQSSHSQVRDGMERPAMSHRARPIQQGMQLALKPLVPEDDKSSRSERWDLHTSQRWRTVLIVYESVLHEPMARRGMTRDPNHLNTIHFERVSFPEDSLSESGSILCIHGLDQLRNSRFRILCRESRPNITRATSSSTCAFTFSVTPPDDESYILAALKMSFGQELFSLGRGSINLTDFLLWQNVSAYMRDLTFRLHDQLSYDVGEMLPAASSEYRDMRGIQWYYRYLTDEALKQSMQTQSPPRTSMYELQPIVGGPLMGSLR